VFVMIGAAGTEAFILTNGHPTTPLVLLVLCALVAFFRRRTIMALLPRK
jgi:hypothetical protein